MPYVIYKLGLKLLAKYEEELAGIPMPGTRNGSHFDDPSRWQTHCRVHPREPLPRLLALMIHLKKITKLCGLKTLSQIFTRTRDETVHILMVHTIIQYDIVINLLVYLAIHPVLLFYYCRPDPP